MFKKILLTGFVLGGLVLSVNSSSAQEIPFRENVIRLSACPCQSEKVNKPCPVDKVCDNCKKSPCNCEKAKENCQKPCNPCQKPKGAWKNSDCCDQDIKNLYEFFNKADCAVGLTCEQKQKSNEIKANSAREITEAKREIATKQSELMGLNASNSCTKSKEIRKINREIKKLEKSIKKIKKNAKKDYKRMLNRTQKQMFKSYQKNSPCPCIKKEAPCAK